MTALPGATDAPAAVSVLCFTAGGVRFAVAAGDVLALGEPAPAARPIAALLGLVDDDELDGQRTLTVRGPGGRLDLRVDGPLVLCDLGVDHVVSAPPVLHRSPAVLGFARVDGELVQLLDLGALVADLPSPDEPEGS
ncbi:MAG TPA: hypothetical protein VM734_13235 [Kofleriaceae bacterium]|nr:hypothetical protein [Kofleriaceae bacterium]